MSVFIAKRLKETRNMVGLSQEEVANKMKISERRIRAIEANQLCLFKPLNNSQKTLSYQQAADTYVSAEYSSHMSILLLSVSLWILQALNKCRSRLL